MNNDNRLNVDKKINVLGIATTNLNDTVVALDYAKDELGSDTIMIKLRDLSFKHCEGYYSKNAKACIFCVHQIEIYFRRSSCGQKF